MTSAYIASPSLGRHGAVSHLSLIGYFQRLADLGVICAVGVLASLALGYESALPIVSSLVFAAIFVVVAEPGNLYQSWRARELHEELGVILLVALVALCLSLAVVAALCLAIPSLEAPLHRHGWTGSLKAAAIWVAVVLSLLLAYRILLRWVLRGVRLAGVNHKRVLLVGDAGACRVIGEHMESLPWYGLSVGEQVSPEALAHEATVERLLAAAQAREFDQVFIVGDIGRDIMVSLLPQLADLSVNVFLVPDIYFRELVSPRIYSIAGIPAIGITTAPTTGVHGSIKRAEDLLIALIALGVFAIPMVLIALAVKVSSPGPVIYRQVRYGLNGKPFAVLKFRTMKVCEHGAQITQARPADTRVTPVGRLLRRWSLDELPQLFNVLQGTMSIVGPRPHADVHNEYYRKRIPSYMLRHRIKPGITGWAQVNGLRGETQEIFHMQQRVEHDLHYIRNWSLGFDLRIIARTLHAVFRPDGAY